MSSKDKDTPTASADAPTASTPASTPNFVDAASDTGAGNREHQQTGERPAGQMTVNPEDHLRITDSNDPALVIEDNSAQFFEDLAAMYGIPAAELDTDMVAKLYDMSLKELRYESALLGIKAAPEGYFEDLRKRSDAALDRINSRQYPALKL